MSILDTLITDRTQADVNRIKSIMQKGLPRMTADEKQYFLRGILEVLEDFSDDALVDADGVTIQCRDGNLPKGAYNYTDLNRVMDAVDYLTERIKETGNSIKNPIKINKTRKTRKTVRVDYSLKNYIKNPTFSNGTDFTYWSYSTNAIFSGISVGNGSGMDFVRVDMASDINSAYWFLTSSNFWAEKDKGALWYFGAQYYLDSGNEAHLQFNVQTRSTADGSNIAHQVHFTNEQGRYVGYGALFQTDVDEAVYRVVPCISEGAKANEKYYMRRPFFYNLTEAFGKGNEPSLEWCQENLGYDAKNITGSYKEAVENDETSDRYKEQDIPTEEEMEIYLSNVKTVFEKLPLVNVRYDSVPVLPETIERLTHGGANDIEKALTVVSDTIDVIDTERALYFSGDLFGGEI